MATKKAGGSVKNGRDSWSKRLGIKKNNLDSINKSNIIIKGFKKRYPYYNVNFSKDYSLVLTNSNNGFVKYFDVNKKKYVIII